MQRGPEGCKQAAGLGNQSLTSEGGAEQEVTAPGPEVTADSTALPSGGAPDEDLELLLAAWSRMPSHVKAGIVAMVRALLEKQV